MKTSILFIFSLLSINAFSIDVKDTTISGTWDLGGQVLNISGRISGTGIIRNAIIVAPNQYVQIFDTTITLVSCRTREFSVIWYGANPANADNYNALQKSINACTNNMDLFIPRGNYRFSRSLKISNLVGNAYQVAALNIYGEAGIWSDATTLTYTDTTGFAVGFQWAKGGSIHNLKIQGKFVSPANNGPAYYNIPMLQFRDALGKCPPNYVGLVIDYDGSKNVGGSTGLKVYDMWIDGFSTLYLVSGNNVTLNGDILKFSDIRCGNGRTGFFSMQAQEKGNEINNIVAWDNLHTLILIGNNARGQAGNYVINGGNIAGGVIRLFDINAKGWFSSYISGIFAESIGQVGTIITGDGLYNPPIVISNCNFDFAFPSQAGVQTLVTSDNNFVKFENCMFRYYGAPHLTMNFAGKATYENCSFSGPRAGYDSTTAIINYPLPATHTNIYHPVLIPANPVSSIKLSVRNN